MSKFTPGPWEWNEGFCGLRNSSDEYILNYDDYEGMWLKSGNEEANARLIAAAPDLLEALIKLREDYIRTLEKAVDIMAELGRDCDPVERMIENMEHNIGVSTAIEKATKGDE